MVKKMEKKERKNTCLSYIRREREIPQKARKTFKRPLQSLYTPSPMYQKGEERTNRRLKKKRYYRVPKIALLDRPRPSEKRWAIEELLARRATTTRAHTNKHTLSYIYISKRESVYIGEIELAEEGSFIKLEDEAGGRESFEEERHEQGRACTTHKVNGGCGIKRGGQTLTLNS